MLITIGIFGAFCGLILAYLLVHHIKGSNQSKVVLMVPASGEHFRVRPGHRDGEFLLDILDSRGTLLKTAGTLRPNSVARAAVLPPALAASLGAKDPFERFELNAEGKFESSDKDEGYQIFPFVLK